MTTTATLVEAPEFDLTSTKPQDVRAFHRCAEKYQKRARVVRSCGGGGGVGLGGAGGGGRVRGIGGIFTQ